MCPMKFEAGEPNHGAAMSMILLLIDGATF